MLEMNVSFEMYSCLVAMPEIKNCVLSQNAFNEPEEMSRVGTMLVFFLL